ASGDLRDCPSFPTRRSSDLSRTTDSATLARRPRAWRSKPARCAKAAWPQDPAIRWGRSPTSLVGPTTELLGTTARSRSLSRRGRSEEHTSELQSRENLVCRL